jgi:hypothetical protein
MHTGAQCPRFAIGRYRLDDTGPFHRRQPDYSAAAQEARRAGRATSDDTSKKGKFFPVPEYPHEGWLEAAIVNACAHRSYGNGMNNMPVFIKMFDDSLIVESPGHAQPARRQRHAY